MSASQFPVTPGVHQMTFKTTDSNIIRYTIFIPSSFDSSQPSPLVMALHYGGTVTPYYGQGYLEVLVEPAFKDLGAIIVAPDCPLKDWHNPTSEKAVIDLMDHIEQNYRIDKSQELITGFSLGGIGTWYLAARYPKRFSAALPVSGMADPKSLEMIKDIPVYVIHSKNDEIFPFDKITLMIEQLKANGLPVQLVALDGISHYNTNNFVPSLKDAIPWIRSTWEKKAE